MAEATVELSFKTEMIVRIDEMSPVKVSVDTEHLLEDGLAGGNEVTRETTALANPIALTRELRKWGVQVGRTSRNRIEGTRSVEAAGSVSSRCKSRGARVVCEGDAGRIGGEDIDVVDLAVDPSVHERDVLEG